MTKEKSQRIKALFKAEHQRMLAFIRSKIASLEESEDLLQEVYVQLLRQVNVLDSIDNLTGWLYTVAKNKIIDWYRRKKPAMVSLDEPVEDGTRFEEILTAEIPDTIDDSLRALVYETIMERIELLPEKQKYVFIQQVMHGRTFRELAEETGESPNTLLARKRYAVMFLRNQLKAIKNLLNEM